MAVATQNGPELHSETIKLAEGPNFGSITTLMPDGHLQTHLIWVATDGERVVVNTEVHRQKYKNVQRDSRITLTIRAEDNPYKYAEVRGRVDETVTGKIARDQLDELSQKYNGEDYPPDQIKSERVQMWIVPERQTVIDQTVDSF